MLLQKVGNATHFLRVNLNFRLVRKRVLVSWTFICILFNQNVPVCHSCLWQNKQEANGGIKEATSVRDIWEGTCKSKMRCLLKIKKEPQKRMYSIYKWCKRLPSCSKTTFIVRNYWDIWITSICCHNICTSVKDNAEQKYAGTDPQKPHSQQWSALLEESIGFTLKCPGSWTSLQLSKITLVQTVVVVIVREQFQHKSTAADIESGMWMCCTAVQEWVAWYCWEDI